MKCNTCGSQTLDLTIFLWHILVAHGRDTFDLVEIED